MGEKRVHETERRVHIGQIKPFLGKHVALIDVTSNNDCGWDAFFPQSATFHTILRGWYGRRWYLHLSIGLGDICLVPGLITGLGAGRSRVSARPILGPGPALL